MEKINKLKIQYININIPRDSEYNPRYWPEKTISDLTNSISKNGFVIPLLLNSAKGRENILISGHFRLKVARDLGYKKLPVTYVNIPDINKEKALNLAINRISGEWDFETLKNFDVEMLLDSGFENIDLSHIWDDTLSVEDDFNAEEELEKIKKPKTKPGDLITLGNHRLICTDSRNPKSIARLLGNSKVSMINFDPIYNIDLDYNNGFGKKGKYGGGVKDKKSDVEYKEFLKTIFQNGLAYGLPDLHIFCWCDQTYIGLIQTIYKEFGITNRRVCLWIKNSQNPTPQVAFNKAYEPCVYGTMGNPYLSPGIKNLNEVLNKEVSTGNRLPDDILDLFDIWLVKRVAGQDYQHPTQKPAALYEKALRRCSKAGDIILDLFAGSGSLMSAAEQLKRRVFMSEIEPAFCDVIVTRYKALTGKEAVYVNSE